MPVAHWQDRGKQGVQCFSDRVLSTSMAFEPTLLFSRRPPRCSTIEMDTTYNSPYGVVMPPKLILPGLTAEPYRLTFSTHQWRHPVIGKLFESARFAPKK